MATTRRTIDRSTAQPFVADEDFSQALPDEFDEAGFVQDVAAAVEADAAENFQRHAHLSSGLVDRDLDAEIVASGYDHEGIANRLQDAQSQIAKISRGDLLPVSLRRVDVLGGVAVSFRVGDQEHLRTAVMTVEAADALEVAHRAGLHAYVEQAAPILARHGHALVMLDPRIAGAANDGAAGRSARKLARRS